MALQAHPYAPPSPPSTSRRRRPPPLTIALLLSFLAAAWIASPLWIGLMLGTVMAFTAQPLHRVLSGRLRDKTMLAAAVSTVLGGLAMLGGGALAIFVVVREVLALLSLVQKGVHGTSIGDFVGSHAGRALGVFGVEQASIAERVQSEVGRLASYAAQGVALVLETTTGLLLTLVIALSTMYYVLLEWPQMSAKLERLSPLEPGVTRALILEFRNVGRGAFVATIASAGVQGLLAWVGFAIAGVPQALTWSVVLAIVSFVPVVGTAAVWGPVGIYLIATGHAPWGAFVLAWGAVVVTATTDYVIRPHLVGARAQGHPLLTLVSLIGGILALGLPGLVVGPVIMSLFVALVRICDRDATGLTPTTP